MHFAKNTKFTSVAFVTLCLVLLCQQTAISHSLKGPSSTAKSSGSHIEPFAAVYNVQNSTGAAFKQYIWSNGAGKFRIENELPYAKVDGITDVIFEDYLQHKRYIANTNFQTIEVHPLGELNVPVTDRELSKQLKARCIGQKKIAGINCMGWRYGSNNEVWVSPELGWYLEFRSRSPQGLVICSAEKVEHKNQTAETFALPGKFKHVNLNETTDVHAHSH